MSALSNSFSAAALILMMVAVGCFCGWRGWMGPAHKGFTVKLIMNLALPCMVVNNLLGKVDRALLQSVGPLLLVPVCAIVLNGALALLLCRLLRLPRNRAGVFVVMSSLANSMFIGYPVCTAAFGEQAVPYVLCYFLVNTTFFQLAGVAFLNHAGSAGQRPFLQSLRQMAKPAVCAMLLSGVLLLLDVKLPDLLLRFTGYMGNMVTPLGLLYTGYVIYELGLGHLRPDRSLWVMLGLRFVASPLLCLGFCRLFGIAGLARSVLAMEMAMPVMTQVVVVSADAGADEGYAAAGTALTTLACFLQIPVLLWLLG